MSRGIDRERKLRALLEADGWWTCRAGAGGGEVDVIAMKQGELPRFIEVKSTAGGPYERFGPEARARLISSAVKAGAIPWLVWWPVRRQPLWIPVGSWPADRREDVAA